MDNNHPIPQDVTGFQFRLIGNMTVKQFAYLAVGCVLALIIYYLPFFLLLKLILMAIFGFTGFALAFIPVEGRPLDAMMGFYLKALMSPNQYIYQRNMGHLSFDAAFHPTPSFSPLPVAVQKKIPPKELTAAKKQQLQQYLQQHQQQVMTPSDTSEQQFLSGIMTKASVPLPEPSVILPVEEPKDAPAQFPPIIPTNVSNTPEPTAEKVTIAQPITPITISHNVSPIPAAPVVTSSYTPSAIPLPQNDSIAEDTLKLKHEQKELSAQKERLKKEEDELKKQKEKEAKEAKEKEEEIALKEEAAQKIADENKMTHDKLLEMEKSFQEMLSQKQQLEQELQRMKDELNKKPAEESFVPTVVKEQPKEKSKLVKQVQQADTKKSGVPHTPDVANVLLGVVKDARGNILPNVLIEVKDQEGSPVRAFKTNQLGQFASATPLANGTYTIDFEDPTGKHNFDTIELTTKGEIIIPLEVTSHDLREELRKELFT